MLNRTFENKDLFPNFLILCKPISEDSNAESGNLENEWNGVLKEMEKIVKRLIDASN
jgi:hypothetical protein